MIRQKTSRHIRLFTGLFFYVLTILTKKKNQTHTPKKLIIYHFETQAVEHLNSTHRNSQLMR